MTNNVRDRFVTGGALQGRLGLILLGGETGESIAAAGTRIGAFEIGEQIGSGGMGAVFRASRVVGGFEQTVAIKLMLASDAGKRERFRAEMEILAGLGHPNIAQLIDGGETADGLLYLAMEYVDGVPLDEYCDRNALGTRERIRLLLTVAEALSHAHRNLVIHRDIKPTNILVGHDDARPKLLDFGIAKLFGTEQRSDLTQQGFGPMTPTYAAPEQFRSQPITVATDVYQFGVLMYRLLGGGLPYAAATDDPIAWARAVLEDEPLALSKAHKRSRDASAVGARESSSPRRGDRDLDAIVRMALMKEPDRRYGSMDALIADLDAYLAGRPVAARHGGTWYRVARFSMRYRWAVLGTSLAILSLAATTFVAATQALQARNEAARLRVSVDLLNGVFKAADVTSGAAGERSLEDLLDTAAKEVVQRLEHHPDLRAGVLVQVADAYVGMGLPVRAAPLYGQAIDDFRSLSSTDFAFTRALGYGAIAAHWGGDVDQARQWLDEATRRATGADDESAILRNRLYYTRWQMLRALGRKQACAEVAQQAVDDAGRANPTVRDGLRQLALVNRGVSATDLKQFTEGERDLLEAVDLGRRLHGEGHADTLNAQQALGWHYGARGDAAKSLAILEPIAQDVLAVFGERSQEWGRNLHNRANAYSMIDGRWEDALAAYLESGRVYRDSTGPRVAVSALFNAANLLREHDRCGEALPLLFEVEQIWRQSDTVDQHYRRVYAELARCELAGGRTSAARVRFEQGVTAYAATTSRDPAYADLLAVGASVAEAEDDRAQAQDLLRQALDIVHGDAAQAESAKQWQQRLNGLQAHRR
jgi:tetratricopeptide (TPR) repeat protein